MAGQACACRWFPTLCETLRQYSMMKRAFDFVAAAAGLVVATPVILLLIIMVRRDSPGTGIFVQDRVGRRGRTFRCYKLRTMRSDAPNVPTHDAPASHITRLGAFLRRTKLDELPQLWNVLRGDMSLVGPRPCLPTQAELIAERAARGVDQLRPGITGLAQVSDIDMSEPVRLATKDAEYLHMQNLRLDIEIICATVLPPCRVTFLRKRPPESSVG